jgi:hypothetical protein
MRKFMRSNNGLPPSVPENPLIPFIFKAKMAEIEVAEADKTEHIKC